MSDVLATAGGGKADSGPNGRNGGRVAYNGGNELELDGYDADAVMTRRGNTIRDDGGGGGADSFDSLPNGPGGRRVQMILVHGEQSESVRGQVGCPKGSYNVFINDGQAEADADMVRVFRLEADTARDPRTGGIIEAFYLGENQWESLVRQVLARIGGQVPGPPSTPAPPVPPGPVNWVPTPDDHFGAQVYAWYVDLLFRPASAADVDSHRGNPGGLDGVHRTIVASDEYKAKHP